MYKNFKCKSCGKELRIAAEKNFVKGRCPNCGSWVEIPQSESKEDQE